AFAEVALRPAYQEALAHLAKLATQPPALSQKRAGVYRTVLKSFKVLSAFYKLAGASEDDTLDHVFADFRAKGYLLVLTEPWTEGEPAHVGLFPTNDKYAVLLACGTN